MKPRVAIIGAGVSGLTCGVVLADAGFDTAIFAAEPPAQTTSAVAAAMWFPYDAEPLDKVIAWALQSYEVFRELSCDPASGVSLIELRTFSRGAELPIPSWAAGFNARSISQTEFVMTVPLSDSSIYLDYLQKRFLAAGGKLTTGVRFARPDEVSPAFDVILNCAGIGARALVDDRDLEPHRGQVVLVKKLDLPGAVVCDDAPLMYAIPRANDCVFGGTNEQSDNLAPDHATTAAIVSECCATLRITPPLIIATRVGHRPFRKSGVRLELDRMADGRPLIHNYGHGGSGFTLSWGCAETALSYVNSIA
ncbi:MAG TPA: FAD-dependent oxidoreductase [Chthoniobacterales bacterium]|nr:FAD-dependent oxidoreductase [Chthoniobacterales bacterium]